MLRSLPSVNCTVLSLHDSRVGSAGLPTILPLVSSENRVNLLFLSLPLTCRKLGQGGHVRNENSCPEN